ADLNDLQRKMLQQDRALDLAPPPAREPAPAEREALVGRAEELGRLVQAFDAAAGGTGGVALIAGPAGIGKTGLAGGLARRARNRGATVLHGRSMDLVGCGLPYLPFVEALKPLCFSGRLDDIRERLPELRRLHPNLSDGAPLELRDAAPETRLRLFSEL